MFTLLTGELVHHARSTNEQLLFAMTKEAPPLETVAPTIAPAVRFVVDRAIAFERDRRWPDASKMQEALRRAYHDRFGKPITTAPRLVVPASVPDRTLSDADTALFSPRKVALPTTGQPVETAPPITPSRSWPNRRPTELAALLGGAVGTLAASALLSASFSFSISRLSLSSHRSLASPPDLAFSAPRPAAVPVSASTSSAAQPPPVIAVLDLPTASASATAAPSSAAQPPHPAASPSSNLTVRPATKGTCDPPFTIDLSTGKKHFKVECL